MIDLKKPPAGLAWWEVKWEDENGWHQCLAFPGHTAFDAGREFSRHTGMSFGAPKVIIELFWDTKLRPEDVYAQGKIAESRTVSEVDAFRRAGDALGSFIGSEAAARVRESVARKRGRKDKKKKRWGFG